MPITTQYLCSYMQLTGSVNLRCYQHASDAMYWQRCHVYKHTFWCDCRCFSVRIALCKTWDGTLETAAAKRPVEKNIYNTQQMEAVGLNKVSAHYYRTPHVLVVSWAWLPHWDFWLRPLVLASQQLQCGDKGKSRQQLICYCSHSYLPESAAQLSRLWDSGRS